MIICHAFCRAMSPAGKMSGCPAQNSRKTSAVHGPIPGMPVRDAIASCAGNRHRFCKSRCPFAQLSATAKIVFSLGRDNPADWSFSGHTPSRLKGSSSSPSASSRRKMASALAFETCCETMIETRLASPGGDRRKEADRQFRPQVSAGDQSSRDRQGLAQDRLEY